MPTPEYGLFSQDFLAELGMLKCTLCGKVGKEEDYQLVPIDEPRALGWVCLGCNEQMQEQSESHEP